MDEQLRSTLIHLEPDPNALLDFIRPQIDDSMLLQIAASDYGMDSEKHLKALREIRDSGNAPKDFRWYPKEVVELIRWSEPSDPAWRPGSPGLTGHLMRAFACAVLLRVAADPKERPYILSEADTLAQLVDSVDVIGPEATQAAMRSLSSRILDFNCPEYGELPFFTMALLLTAVRVRRGAADGPILAALAKWTIDEERLNGDDEHGGRMGGWQQHWLLGLTFDTIKAHRWIDLAQRILLEPSTPHLPDADPVLRHIGRLLAFGSDSTSLQGP